MDFEVMPQVDKSASTYSPPVQYVPAISSTSTLARPELSKFGVPNDILTSCDWSAVIHRPAEDSEPEDLPSTVDIDAIKEPATPLPPLTPGHHQDDDGSDSDDEESSGSESDDAGSSSDSESQSQDGSGSESSLSEDSDSSEASGKPRLSSESSPEPQREQSPTNFNEKETNRSEGAIEQKVSTTKSKSSPSRSSSSSSSSSSSDCEEQARTVSEPQFAIAAKKKPIVFKENATVSRTSSSSSSGKDSKDSKQSKATALCASDRNLSSVKSREMVTNAARSSGASVVRRTPVKRPALRSASQRKSAVSPRKPLRGARKSPRTRRSGNSGGGESSSQLESSDEDDEVQGNADDITNLAHQLRVQGISDPLQEINQEDLAAILPDVTGGGSLDGFEEENAVGGGSREPALRGGGESTTHSHLSTSSTSSSSSDSDTEQIVSDVISRIQDDSEPPPPPSTSTTTTSAAKTTSRTVQLSPSSPLSDRSTRNQIGNVYSSNLLADFVEKTELLSRGGGGSVSSSSECPRRNEENSSEIEPSNASGDTFKRRRGRPSRQLKGVSSTGNRSSSGMPELEAYMRLDCSQSNVSPDSGIQSVAGSPAGGHHSPPGSPRSPVASSSHICGGPPVLSKASSPSPSRQDDLSSSNNKLAKIIATSGEMKLENGGKKGPGRPKLSVHSLATFGRRKRKRSKKTDNNRAKNSASQLKAPVERREMVSEIKVPPFIASEYSSDVDESDVRSKSTEQSSHLPKLPAAMVKRGRGRPKKSPPVLEPNFPLPGEEKTKQPRDNSPGDSGLLTLPDKSKELALKCAKIAFTKGLMKNKEHKHKKRKRHGPEFRRLNPEFLSELSRLADMIRTSCYISPPSPKKDVSRCLKIKKPSKNKRKRRSLTVEPVEEPKQSESQASKESDKIVDPVVKQSPENNELPKQSENQSSVKSNSSKKERKSSKSSRNKEKDRTKEKSLALRERNVNRNSSRRDKRTSRHSKEKSRANSDKEKPTVAAVEMENVASLVKVTDEKDDDKPVNFTSSEQTVTFVPKGEISTQTGREDVDDEKDYNVSGRSSAALQEKIEPTTPQSSSAASLTPEASLVPDNVPVKSKVATAGHRERNPTRELHSKDKIKLSRESTPAKDKTAAASSVCSDLLAPSPALSEEKDKLKDKLRSSSPASKDKPPLPSKDKPSSASSSRERSATAPSLHSREKSTSNSSQKDKDSKVSCGSPGSAPISQKRRVKKSAVEFPKKEKREETNSNEQRLPLKKRHYVTSASSTVLGINDESGEVTSELEIKAEGECGPKQPSPSSCDSKSPAVSPSETKTDPKRPDKDDALVNKDKSEVQVEAEKKPPIQTRTRDKDIAIAVVESVPRRTPSRTCSSSNSTPSSSKRLSTRHKSAADNQRSNGVVPLKRSQRLKTKNEEEVVDKPSPLTKETSKRQAKVCDEPLEQKLADLVKNGDKLKCESLADIQISTRSFSKSLTADGCPDGDLSKATTGSQPPEGIFVPSVKPALEILKLALPSQSEVLSKIKSKLLSDINVDEELNIIKRSAAESGIESAGPSRPKRRKTEADSRPIVRATPGTIVKLKMKRKKINRTGFPVKKKKKKRMDVTGVANGSTPPVLEDQTKLKIITDADPSTPALSPIVPKTEETVKENLVEPTTTQPSKPEEIPEPDSMPPQADVEAVPDTLETSAITVTNKDKTGEQSNCLRPASKRIMELKAKSEAVGQRKRKQVAEDSQEEEESKKEGSEECPEMKFLTKKAKKCKEELDDSDAESVKLGKKILPKWRKKYLPAGLFSDYFKEDEPRKPSTDKSKGDSEIVDLLPLPAYCAKWVRQRKLPFQLPHDIWWLHTHNQLPGREAVPSWNYRKLRTNFYFDVKPSFSYEAQACNCKPTEEVCCGDDCINRMVFAECSPQLCPCKDKCSNQKIQRHDWAPGLAKFMTKDKGWGVKTKQKIQKDEFILEYVGEVVSEKEFKSRMASRYQNDTHHYCLNLDGGLVIDGHRMGGDGRFVNHSCEPNCEMQKWCVNGLFRMALFALRDINPNEELTYDYNFSLFNPSEGQPCKCGSSKCRGVIGGKYQRVSLPGSSGVSSNTVEEKEKPVGQVGRPRKSSCASSSRRKSLNVDKKVATNKSSRDLKSSQNRENSKEAFGSNALATVAARLCHMTQLKPITPQQRLFIIDNKIFLLRTLQKVKERVEKLRKAVKNSGLLAVCDIPLLNANLLATAGANGSPSSVVAPTSQNSQINGTTSSIIAKEGEKEVFMSQLKALSNPRSVRTRRLALAEDNPEMTKAARLACVFKNLYSEVINFKDESGDYLSSNFTTLPSKRKLPLYYQRVQNPIDFNTIEQNIVTGVYKTVESFDLAMNTLFKNNVRWYGRITDLGIAATRLRKIYNLAKLECLPKLEEILGEPPPASFIPARDDPSGEEEDVIRCICGMYRDEGLMIQCERCLVWQHCYCVKANSSVEKYLCERCNPREVDLEIPSQEEPDENAPGQTNYLTLLRGDLQLKQGDTVYVLRDIVDEESTTVPKSKHTYKTIKNWKYIDCDIFKIERLWKDEKGDRFAFGHHYLRPHETFHEPTRKFFPNELMRVPLYEVVPIDLIMDHCYVLDLNTYCKGRPLGSNPDHIYVCEYRVDKVARMFAKIPKPKHSNVCTKAYAFETFDVRLKPQRTYAPHGPPKESFSSSSTSTLSAPKEARETSSSRGRGGKSAQNLKDSNQNHEDQTQTPATPLPARSHQLAQYPPDKRLAKKTRLDRILQRLLAKLPSKQPLDLSYLLEPGRRQRKKPPLLAS